MLCCGVTAAATAAETRNWKRQLGTNGNDPASAVSTDIAGNIYVAGSTYGSLDGAWTGRWEAPLLKFSPGESE